MIYSEFLRKQFHYTYFVFSFQNISENESLFRATKNHKEITVRKTPYTLKKQD